MVEQDSVGINKESCAGSRTLQFTPMNDLPTQVFEVEFNFLLHVGSQLQLGRQLHQVGLLVHLSHFVVTLQRDDLNFFNGLCQISFFFGILDHILVDSRQQKSIPLDSGDRGFEESIPAEAI